ncbi:MAG: tyrosine-type recombinase/integrase [Gemmatimonadales bacterium]|nr:tyrosine-type recombinase/integrase [Gemmatimonadales bacterium]
MFADFIRSLERANFAPNSITAYISDLKRITELVPDLTGADTSALESALDSLTESGVAAASRNRTVAALRKFYGFLVAHGARADNPAASLGYAATQTTLPVSLDGNDIERLLGAAATGTKFYRKRDIAIISLLAGSGLRRNELATLEVSDIDLDAGAILVRQGKGRKQRRVPVWGEKLDAIRDHIEALPEGSPLWPSRKGGAMSVSAIWKLVKRLAKKAGLSEKISPHTLRHAYATAAHAAGMDTISLKNALGHSNIGTTEGYVHVSVDTLRVKGLYR